MKEREDQLNTHFAQSDFKLDEGENLLKEMQHLRDELSQYEDEVQRLIETAGEIVPLRARRERLRQPIEAVAICKYQSSEVCIEVVQCYWKVNFRFLKRGIFYAIFDNFNKISTKYVFQKNHQVGCFGGKKD